jgi:hypothetical protein
MMSDPMPRRPVAPPLPVAPPRATLAAAGRAPSRRLRPTRFLANLVLTCVAIVVAMLAALLVSWLLYLLAPLLGSITGVSHR